MTSSPRLRRRLALASALVAAGAVTGGAVAAGAATAVPSPSGAATASGTAGPAASERQHRKAQRRPGPAPDGSGRAAAPTSPAFLCDPALSHGEDVSAYARSLPKGPGRGRLISVAARSDCD